jgi:hypothetical protein
MLANLSTKALYAKLHTFLPKITSWDVPFTAQEEQTRVQFVTQGEGFETLQSVMPQYKKIRWAELPIAELPVAELPVAELPVAEVAIAELPIATSCTSLEPTSCTSLEPAVDDFQVVKSKGKAPQAPLALNPAGIRTVVARNLPRDIKDAEIRALFGAHAIAGLRDVYIPRNTDKSSPHFGTLKGFALIKFHTAEESTRAYEALKMLSIRGKNVALEFAKEDR